MLHVGLDYTNTRYNFYGPELEHKYDCVRARRDPMYVEPPLRLFPRLSQSIVFLTELENLLQLNTRIRHIIANNMQETLVSAHVTFPGDMSIPLSLPCALIPLYDDSYLDSLGCD